MTKNKKAIIHIQTGILYESLAQAAAALNIPSSLICRMLKGIATHTQGQNFRYAYEEKPMYGERSAEEILRARERARESYERKKQLKAS